MPLSGFQSRRDGCSRDRAGRATLSFGRLYLYRWEASRTGCLSWGSDFERYDRYFSSLFLSIGENCFAPIFYRGNSAKTNWARSTTPAPEAKRVHGIKPYSTQTQTVVVVVVVVFVVDVARPLLPGRLLNLYSTDFRIPRLFDLNSPGNGVYRKINQITKKKKKH